MSFFHKEKPRNPISAPKASPTRSAILYSLSSILLLPGCMKETKPVAAVNRSPLIVDEAMQQRIWPRTVVRFQNGETPAGPTGFILEHNPDVPHDPGRRWSTDTPLFLANVLVMPVGYMFTAPWQRVIYPAGVAEPSFTGIPPIAPK